MSKWNYKRPQIIDKYGQSIALVRDPKNGPLLAAARDLLEALRNLHNWGETFFHGHPKAMTEAGKLLKRLDAGKGGQ